MSERFFVTGIGTGVGKTIVSAFLTCYFRADYWKPVQSGDPDHPDSRTVRELTGGVARIHPERYWFRAAVSPHEAAAMEGVNIELSGFVLPDTRNGLIVEGAGGLFAPLNDSCFMIDLIDAWELPAVLVVRDYLGCINHTMLSFAALAQRRIPLAYVALNGAFRAATKDFILAQVPPGVQLIQLPNFRKPDKDSLERAVEHFIKG